MASVPIISWQIEGVKVEEVADFIFLGSKITADGDVSQQIKRHLLLRRKSMTNLDSIFKKQRYHFADKGLYGQSHGFSSGHVRIWELDNNSSVEAEVLMLLNCGAEEDSWQSLGLQGDTTSQS